MHLLAQRACILGAFIKQLQRSGTLEETKEGLKIHLKAFFFYLSQSIDGNQILSMNRLTMFSTNS